MLPTMRVLLPDGNELTLDEGASGRDAAAAIGPRLADAAVAVQVDGDVRDLRLPVRDGETIRILTDRDDAALAVLRHSTAHVMAQAVLHLWPDAKIAIGPAIADGFYYDFEFPEPISPDDLERIEEEMRRILASDVPFVREDGVDRSALIERFRAEGQPYKLELAEGLDDGAISLYRNDDFEDLCRGPHLQTTKPIKAFKLLSTAGAYWRGDSTRPMLTRIYGTAFFRQADLDAHLAQIEEARRRDHRRIGRELDLFHFDPHSPGSPLWHPRGMVIWNALEDLRRSEERQPRLRRGEDAAALRRRALEDVRPLGEVPRRHVPRPGRERGPHLRPEADELPRAHAALRQPAAQLPRASAALRGVLDPAPERADGDAARAHAGAARHPGRRPHLLHDGADRGRDLRVPRATSTCSTASSE